MFSTFRQCTPAGQGLPKPRRRQGAGEELLHPLGQLPRPGQPGGQGAVPVLGADQALPLRPPAIEGHHLVVLLGAEEQGQHRPPPGGPGAEGVVHLQAGHAVHQGPGGLALHHRLGAPAQALSPRPPAPGWRAAPSGGVATQGGRPQNQARAAAARASTAMAAARRGQRSGGWGAAVMASPSPWARATAWRMASISQRSSRVRAVIPAPGATHSRAVTPPPARR